MQGRALMRLDDTSGLWRAVLLTAVLGAAVPVAAAPNGIRGHAGKLSRRVQELAKRQSATPIDVIVRFNRQRRDRRARPDEDRPAGACADTSAPRAGWPCGCRRAGSRRSRSEPRSRVRGQRSPAQRHAWTWHARLPDAPTPRLSAGRATGRGRDDRGRRHGSRAERRDLEPARGRGLRRPGQPRHGRQSIPTATARTSRASWRATAALSQGRITGVAPEANLVSVRVLDGTGRGQASDLLAGLQWVLEHKDLYGIRVAQPVARTSRLRARRGRPARGAGRGPLAGWHRRGLLGGQRGSRRRRDHQQPLQRPQRDHRRRAQRPRHARHGRRHRGELLGPGALALRPGGQAGPAGVGEPDRVPAFRRLVPRHAPPRAARGGRPVSTRRRRTTSSCPAPAWRPRSSPARRR